MRDDAGGILTADLLLRAYASGVFPMAEDAGSDTHCATQARSR